ncbi:hypothetical protein BCR34DRAFT_253151 [Clohesyomyces aquaticus]|uniref:Uncharacterized protein n=1 Tax=Clohesyomyces aquaticus TaxID=1231657 RepID=A0A1Y1ZUE8_9PLEO|nr:hypothetical protein BCR34DRAFT_253151 [Clohesyomyces aquaticus]
MVVFNRTKKKLQAAELEKQRLEDEIVAQRRAQQASLELQERRMEATRRQLESAHLAREDLERQAAEQRVIEYEKARLEAERLDREARIRAEKHSRIKAASPETLRDLRELIRDKYQLDLEIWELRNARRPDRWIVDVKMEKADAVVSEIMAMVVVWERREDGDWNDDEWERVQEIRERLMSGGIRIWANESIWTEGGAEKARASGVGRRGTRMSMRHEAPDRRYSLREMDGRSTVRRREE